MKEWEAKQAQLGGLATGGWTLGRITGSVCTFHPPRSSITETDSPRSAYVGAKSPYHPFNPPGAKTSRGPAGLQGRTPVHGAESRGAGKAEEADAGGRDESHDGGWYV